MKANRRAGRAEIGPREGCGRDGTGRTADALVSAGRSSVDVRSYAAAAATLNINLLHRCGQSASNRRESRPDLRTGGSATKQKDTTEQWPTNAKTPRPLSAIISAASAAPSSSLEEET